MAKLIKTDGIITEVFPENGKTFTLKELQKFVNGNIELVYIKNKPDHIMFINEEGKLQTHNVNIIATEIADIDPMDYIAGDAIVCNLIESGDEDSDG
jgi:hypothetical protein